MTYVQHKPTLVVGRHPVLEKLEAKAENVERIYVGSTAKGTEINAILHTADRHDIPVQRVPLAKLNRLTRKLHQGVVAYTTTLIFYDVEQIITGLYAEGKSPLLCILDSVEDVGNVGAMARTAWAAGFHALILPFKKTPLLQEGAIKASAGTLQHIRLCRERDFHTLIPKLQSHGIQVIGTVADVPDLARQVSYKAPTAIVIGNEHDGIRESMRLQCDKVCKLPMAQTLDSYNVSVAFGMIAYEVLCQRGTPS